jgi:hypothetical protein
LEKYQDTSNHTKISSLQYAKAKRLNKKYRKNIIHNSKNKYKGINLTKEVKNFYNENSDTMKKEIEEDISKWEDLPRSWVGRIIVVKMVILLKAISVFNVVPIKIPM